MMRKKLLSSKLLVLLTVTMLLLGAIFPAALLAEPSANGFTVTVLGTSDLHGQIMGYDYFKKAPSTGMTRIATLVAQERAKYPNNILVDAGDEIQGTPLVTNYNLVDKSWITDPSKTYPMIAAFDYMKYDALVLGNHEFNFGLGVLGPVIDKASAVNLPYLSANTLDVKATTKDPVTGDQPVWGKVKPYTVKTFKDPEGKDFKVGILGLTTPAIPNWDAADKWDGLKFADIVTEGTKWVQYLKTTEKVNAIVAVIHSGLGDDNPADDSTPNENEVLAFANANPEVNMILAGHTHSVINAQTGTNKIWTVEPKNGAANLEEVVMNFVKDSSGNWTMDPNTTTAASLSASTSVAEDTGLVALAKPYHDAALNYLQTKIGTSSAEFSADGQTVKDTALMDLVNKVQMYYGDADLSMAAPFSPTARIPEGDVTVGDVSSVYVYENFLYTVKVTGKQLRNYLEFSVGRYYKQYQSGDTAIVTAKDPASGKTIPDYNLDLLQGANYTVDLTKTGLYDAAGKALLNGEPRITKLQYKGQDIKDTDEFKLAINDYRKTGGGGFMAAAGIVPQDTDPKQPNYITYDSRKVLGDGGQVRSLMIQYFKDVAAGKVSGVSQVKPEVDNNWKTVPVFYDLVEFTDTHGNIDDQAKYDSKDPKKAINKTNAALMAGAVNAEKYAYGSDRTVLLAGGDMMQGTSISNMLKGQPVIDVMNQMGFDAMELGNHEFDWGLDTLDQRLKDAKFPFLAANLTLKAGDTDVNAAQLVKDIKPYTIIKDKDGLNIGVIGVITPETETIVTKSIIGHFDIGDPAVIINKLVPEVKAAGADLVVVLAHDGDKAGTYDPKNPPQSVPFAGALPTDIGAWAKDVKGVDAILGGHSHSINYDKINGIPGAIGNSSGKGAATIRLVLDSSNKVIDSVPGYLNIYDTLFKTLTPDADVQAVVSEAKVEVAPVADEVIGTAEQDLPKVTHDEMALGDWITDVTLANAPGAEFGFQNEGGIRITVPKGPITVGTIWAVMPFDNTVVTMDLTGVDVLALLEQGVSRAKGNIQVAGLKFTYDPNLPVYHRVLSASKLDGTPIDPNKTYTIATNDFLSGGQDGYVTFKNGKNLTDTHTVIREAMIKDLRTRKTLSGVADGRAKAVAELAPAPVAVGKTVTITAKIGLNVRDGASLSANILDAIPFNGTAEVVGVEGDWYKIKYGSGNAYIFAAYTK